MSILIIAEHDHASLRPATLNTLTAAGELGGEVDILIAGADCAGAADAAAKLPGVAKVRVADAPEYGHELAENLAPLIAKLATDYTHVLAPATTFGKNVMPRAAALLDVQQISDISAIEGADTFVRPIYAGNAMATVKSLDTIKLITVRATAFDAAAEDGGSAVTETVESTGDTGLASFVGQELTQSPNGPSSRRRGSSSSGRPRHAERRKLRHARAHRRQAGGRGRRQPRGGRCRLRAQRLPGRPDPARWWRPTYISRSASRARSSTWRA